MNDPNKAINVNLSSLLSLKAELLRKEAEVNKAKASRTINDEYTASAKVNKHTKKIQIEPEAVCKKDDGTVIYEHDDSALLDKSKKVLDAKSKYYEKMCRSGGSLNSDDNCLVLFNRKHQDEKPHNNGLELERTADTRKDDSSELSSSSDSECDNGGSASREEESGDWVEYTDCLGRTRKCLKEDLENAKKRDADLAASMPERLDQSKACWLIDTKGGGGRRNGNEENDDETIIGPAAPTESIFNDGCSLMSKHDEQRINWEKKEQENLGKSEVHYQDVFFDEARQHGVGYYAFSTDEEERKRQQQELEDARLKTIDEQKRRDELRAQREKIIAERVRAAKNRQRARLGLPPLGVEEFEKEQQQSTTADSETKEERKARKRAEKLKRRQEAEEAARELERKEHVRPWDEEKEGVKSKDKTKSSTDNYVEGESEWKYKPERVPMSQEEYNEKMRSERRKEFAPVPEPELKLKRTNFTNSKPAEYNLMPPPPAAAAAAVQVPTHSASFDNEIAFVSYQTTRKNKSFQRRNYETEVEERERIDNRSDRCGTAIPPPENLDADYGLPAHAKRPKTNNELERSIEAGLRFLRNSSDKGTLSTKSSWTAKADY